MNFNKCTRCGCFYVTDGATCPSCQEKDEKEISKLNNFFIENDNDAIQINELSSLTGISVKNITRFAANKELGFKKKIKEEKAPEPVATAPVAETKEENMLPGGWQNQESMEITDEIREMVEKATADMIGADYTAIAYIGRQIVNGTNHKILCKIAPVTPNGTATYAIVTIYEDLNGNVKITEIQNGATLLDIQVDELMSSIPSRLPEK